jgi:Cu(I)/Ag(I) efflux system membrane fusion protein
MRNKWKNSYTSGRGHRLVLMALCLVWLIACTKKESAHDEYTCPMHPTVLADKPGTCPVCGMDLVRKARPGEVSAVDSDLTPLLKSTNEVVASNVKTIKGEYRTVPLSQETQGMITYDTRNSYTLSVRTGGRLEKVFLKYAFQSVNKGQKVAELYSPELITAQRELLFVLESDAENTTLVEAAKKKLALLGVDADYIRKLVATKTVAATFPIYSPYSGYVVTTTQQTPPTLPQNPNSTSPSGMDDGDMGTSANASVNTPAITGAISGDALLREGDYVSAGQTLFNIVNTAALRIELDVPAAQASAIRKGDVLTLDFGNGSLENATIDFVQPYFAQGEEFLKLRVYTKHMQDLHIGHLVRAKVQLTAKESLWVPRDAVLDMGRDRLVFVKDGSMLKPKKVTTGVHAKGWIEITNGLAVSDEIAANAHYLVDSESFVKTNP